MPRVADKLKNIMEDIEFRAWHHDSKIMFDVFAIMIHMEKIVVKWHGAERAIPSKQFSIMKYAGHKDKNGIKIYGGDIVKYEGITSGGSEMIDVVHYSRQEARFMRGMYPLIDHSIVSLPIVIGNIYQNPELLTP